MHNVKKRLKGFEDLFHSISHELIEELATKIVCKNKLFLNALWFFSLFLLAANALAQSLFWSSATDLSSVGEFSDDAQIAASSDGTKATAVWRSIGNNNSTSIQSSSATISEGVPIWGPVTVVSSSGQDANIPQISLSSDGTKATVVWLRGINGSSSVIQSASATISERTASWSSVTDVSATGQDAGEPQISLSSDGTQATAVWSRYNGSNYIVQSASSTISGKSASWASASDLSVDGKDARHPQISLSSDGTKATAIWYHGSSSDSIVQSASAMMIENSATWSSGADLSDTGQVVYFPHISISSNGGNATAIWARWNGSNMIIQSASATIVGGVANWGTVTDLSASGHTARNPQIALSSDGKEAAAIWTSDSSSSSIIQNAVATITSNSSDWSPVFDLTGLEKSAISPQISISSDGTKFTAVWQRWTDLNVVIQSVSATSVESSINWSSVTNLTANGENASAPKVSVSLDGTKATTVWSRRNGLDNIIQSASSIEKYEGDNCYVIESESDKVVVFCL